jgi:flavorubredoxin
MTATTLPPHRIADDVFVVPLHWHPPGAPVGVHLNTAVLRSAQPVLFDTGPALFRDDWLRAVSEVVDLDDVRWVVLSHDDPDHVGNLPAVLEHCPNATVVANWFLCERMGPELAIDPRRLRWVDADQTLDIGDRSIAMVRPPLYDNPTTRISFDPISGFLWGADLFASPVPEPTLDAGDMDPAVLFEGFMQFQRWVAPWYELVEPARYQRSVDDLAALDVKVIGSTHGPAFVGGMVDHAFDLLRRVADEPALPWPGQPVLDEIVAHLPAGAPV